MPGIFQDNIHSVGHTPLVRLDNLAGDTATVLAKIEGRNPAFSIKDRVAAAMLDDAVQRGALRPGMTIVEPTSGNTGIGLAFASAVREYRCILTMPETMSMERRRVLRMLGAELVLTPGAEGMAGAIRYAEKREQAWDAPVPCPAPQCPPRQAALASPRILLPGTLAPLRPRYS